MKNQLLMPQEVEVFYIIPALKRELAIAMKAIGRKQKEIAKALCVEESTISQYINDKRAVELKLNDRVRKEVVKSVGNISDKSSYITQVQRLLMIVKQDKSLCEIHKLLADVPKACDICFLKV